MVQYQCYVVAGNLTRDPEVRFLQNGTAVVGCSIAVSAGWGERKHTWFLDFAIFGKTAEKFAEWMHKGDAVILQGTLGMDKWQDKKTGDDREKIKLTVQEWSRAGGGKRDDDAPGGGEGQARRPKTEPGREEELDNIPF